MTVAIKTPVVKYWPCTRMQVLSRQYLSNTCLTKMYTSLKFLIFIINHQPQQFY